MEENDLPLPRDLAGHQRRAVFERGDGALGQRRVGLGHDLRGDADLVRNREAEEGAVGGFGSHVSHHLLKSGALDDGRLRFRTLFMPDNFMDQASPAEMNSNAGIDRDGIMAAVFAALGQESNAAIRA